MLFHRLWKPVLLFFVMLPIVGACRSAPEPKSVDTLVRETLKSQVDAWNRGDIRGFMAGYYNSPETSFLSGTKLTRGFTPVLEGYERRYPPGKQGSLQFEIVEIAPLSLDAAYVIGRYRLSGEVAQTGMFTLVLRRRDGRFVVVHDHTSADPPEKGN